MCLGTDVFIGGIKNIGPTKLDEFCKKNAGESLYKNLLSFMCKKQKLSTEFILTLQSALIHEPCISHDHVGPFLYLTPPPSHFPKYLAEFTDRQDCVVDGPEMKECCGLRGNKHVFLVAEGNFSKYVSCDRYVCSTCKFCHDGVVSCDECFSSIRLLSCDKNSSDIVALGGSFNKTGKELRQEILDAGFDVGNDVSPSEL